jgi:hypothetical protein
MEEVVTTTNHTKYFSISGKYLSDEKFLKQWELLEESFTRESAEKEERKKKKLEEKEFNKIQNQKRKIEMKYKQSIIKKKNQQTKQKRMAFTKDISIEPTEKEEECNSEVEKSNSDDLIIKRAQKRKRLEDVLYEGDEEYDLLYSKEETDDDNLNTSEYNENEMDEEDIERGISLIPPQEEY